MPKFEEILILKRKLYTMEYYKIILEKVIILLVLLSAITKLNVFSLIYILLTSFYLFFKKNRIGIRIITNFIGVLLLLRLLLFISNLESNFSPMVYPKIFSNKESLELSKSYSIPWIYRLIENKETRKI